MSRAASEKGGAGRPCGWAHLGHKKHNVRTNPTWLMEPVRCAKQKQTRRLRRVRHERIRRLNGRCQEPGRHLAMQGGSMLGFRSRQVHGSPVGLMDQGCLRFFTRRSFFLLASVGSYQGSGAMPYGVSSCRDGGKGLQMEDPSQAQVGRDQPMQAGADLHALSRHHCCLSPVAGTQRRPSWRTEYPCTQCRLRA